VAPGGHGPDHAMLQAAKEASGEARASGAPIDEVAEQRAEALAEPHFGRRALLGGAAALGAAAVLGRPRRATAADAPQIVIVGAGLAGLRCAHLLWTERGLASTVFEWDDSPGGRVATYRDVFANGQIVEEHGEFISSEHTAMLGLVQRFGLGLDNTNRYPPGTEDTYWFEGQRYTQAMLNADWHAFGWRLFHRAVQAARYPTDHTRSTPTARAWDQLSVAEWIEQYVPGGLASPFGGLCYQATIDEYGGPPEEQSALNLVYLLGFDDSTSSGRQPKGAPVLGGTDEQWHVHGGNDQVVTGLVGELPPGTVETGQRLVALRERSGRFVCTFEDGSGRLTEVPADHVVLAIPFNKLAEVDLSRVRLRPLKRRAIAELRLGTNAKVALQVAGRPWQADGYTGNEYADNGAASGWDITNYQPGRTGILLDFPGGAGGAALAVTYGLVADNGPAPPAMVADYLVSLEPLFPGIGAAWAAGPGIAWYADGAIDEHLGGAWSYYRIGQYTGFAGVEGEREGNLHFAGEHTSYAFQGFMEGALRSGERVAGEI